MSSTKSTLYRSTRLAALIAGPALVAAAPATAATQTVKVSATPITASLSTSAYRSSKIAVKNTSKRRLSGLTVSVTRPKGVTIVLSGAKKGRLSRTLKPLKMGRTLSVSVRVRRARTGPKRGRLTVKVTRARKTLASARLTFGVPAAAPAPAVDPNSLAGRYFWGSNYTVSGIQQNTLYFTGPTLVYTAATEGAWPDCTAVTETCKPYAYDAASGQLTIDGKPATLAGRQLTLDGDTYGEWGAPPAGSLWDTVVTYANSSGICPLYCTYHTEYLTFRPDGTFLRSAVASGTGPIVDWTAVPPDSKGTYEVRADRTLRLAFADGTERIRTVALYLNDDGSLKTPGEGLLLGGDGYFDIRNG